MQRMAPVTASDCNETRETLEAFEDHSVSVQQTTSLVNAIDSGLISAMDLFLWGNETLHSLQRNNCWQ